MTIELSVIILFLLIINMGLFNRCLKLSRVIRNKNRDYVYLKDKLERSQKECRDAHNKNIILQSLIDQKLK